MSRRLRHAIRVYEVTITLIVLISALLLPRISAVAAELLPGANTIVICTGFDYVTITLGDDGTPTKVSETTEGDCLRAADVALAETPEPAWQAWARQYALCFSCAENPHIAQDGLARLEAARAPPVVI
jgi:hypothetical protein